MLQKTLLQIYNDHSGVIFATQRKSVDSSPSVIVKSICKRKVLYRSLQTKTHNERTDIIMKKKLLTLIIAITTIITSTIPIHASSAQQDLKIGDYVKMGTYNSTPMIFRYVGDDENGKLMVCKDIVCYKAFDAMYDDSDLIERYNLGSHLWSDSSIRTWLNSNESTVIYTPSETPSEDKVERGKNSYDKEPGFLTNFNTKELDAIKTVTLKTTLSEYDSDLADGEHETYTFFDSFDGTSSVQKYQNTTDKMFLLDENQLNMIIQNLGTDFLYWDKWIYEGYLEELTDNYKTIYSLRTPRLTGLPNCTTHIWLANGELTYGDIGNASSSHGIRPAFYLEDSTEFTEGNGSKETPYIISNEPVGNTSLPSPEKILKVINDKGNLTLSINNNELLFTDAKPFIDSNDRTQAPVRAIAEELNYSVIYDDTTKDITISDGVTTIFLTVGSNILKYDDITIEMDTTAQIINEHTYIPVRFLMEALGYKVEYSEKITGYIIDENGVIIPAHN